ncbi:NAD(P)/FAD-dependent oxidoreductase [Pedobacter jamesrossensis]|uniref:NAD(P)/FAD-dependent oxidoreductase n=1 Tax=Pedobacter jamesrossensis TaxID=1908238 RepID=A0ABV8NF60_9SPHI
MDFDVIIIGGSYAGLSAGLALGRSMRKVLIIDSGKPCNLQTPHAHNFLTHDGDKPASISAKAKAEVLKYPTISFLSDLVISAKSLENRVEIKTEGGKIISARKILLATGLKDVMPDIKGFSDCWAISIIHCPYCHGYEVRDERIGLMMNGDIAFEMAKNLHHWNKDLTILTHGISQINDEQREKLRSKSIKIIEDEVLEFRHLNGQLQNVVFKSGKCLAFKAVYARPEMKQHSELYKDLNYELTDTGLIKINEHYETTVKGIYATGDCVTPARGLSVVTASGTMAAVMMNREMISEDF